MLIRVDIKFLDHANNELACETVEVQVQSSVTAAIDKQLLKMELNQRHARLNWRKVIVTAERTDNG